MSDLGKNEGDAAHSKPEQLQGTCLKTAISTHSTHMLEDTDWYAAWKERKIRMLGSDDMVEVFGWYWRCEHLESGRLQATCDRASKIRFQVEGDDPEDLWQMIGIVTMRWEPLESRQ